MEYVLRIVVRDPDRPLSERVLIEAGASTENPRRFTEALAGLVDMLRVLKTPEAVAEFMRENATAAKTPTLLTLTKRN